MKFELLGHSAQNFRYCVWEAQSGFGENEITRMGYGFLT